LEKDDYGNYGKYFHKKYYLISGNITKQFYLPEAAVPNTRLSFCSFLSFLDWFFTLRKPFLKRLQFEKKER
jgi:hypothetical protein